MRRRASQRLRARARRHGATDDAVPRLHRSGDGSSRQGAAGPGWRLAAAAVVVARRRALSGPERERGGGGRGRSHPARGDRRRGALGVLCGQVSAQGAGAGRDGGAHRPVCVVSGCVVGWWVGVWRECAACKCVGGGDGSMYKHTTPRQTNPTNKTPRPPRTPHPPTGSRRPSGWCARAWRRTTPR